MFETLVGLSSSVVIYGILDYIDFYRLEKMDEWAMK